MKTKKTHSLVMSALYIGMALSASLVNSQTASAADMQLDKAIKQGHDIFSHNTFSGNGKFCESCHVAGGAEPGKLPNGKVIPSLSNAAAIFPRFNAKMDKVITLQDQVRACAANALQGTPPDYGSKELNAITSYITSLAQGKSIDMGGKPQ